MATSSRSTADFATNASMPTGSSACLAHEKLSKAGVTITTESAHTAHSVTKLQMNLPRLSRSNNRNHLSWDNSLSCWIHRRGDGKSSCLKLWAGVWTVLFPDG